MDAPSQAYTGGEKVSSNSFCQIINAVFLSFLYDWCSRLFLKRFCLIVRLGSPTIYSPQNTVVQKGKDFLSYFFLYIFLLNSDQNLDCKINKKIFLKMDNVHKILKLYHSALWRVMNQTFMYNLWWITTIFKVF